MKELDYLFEKAVLRPVVHKIESGEWKYENDRVTYKTAAPIGNGWIISQPCFDRDCIRWQQVVFDHYRIIPKPCFGCFKVVVVPRTVVELVGIMKMQQKEQTPCKCGIEQRNYVGRDYGAYWYAPLGKGLKAARALFDGVKTRIAELSYSKEQGMPRMIIKRGCTEFELAFGDSAKWPSYDYHDEILWGSIDQAFNIVPVDKSPRTLKNDYTLIHWLKFAASRGDMTYKELTDCRFTVESTEYQLNDNGIDYANCQWREGEHEQWVGSFAAQMKFQDTTTVPGPLPSKLLSMQDVG